MAFDKGETVVIYCQGWDGAGTKSDPDTLELRVRKPDATIETFAYPATITRTVTGSFEKDYIPDQSGAWFFEWKAIWTSAPATTAIEPGEFAVRDSVIA